MNQLTESTPDAPLKTLGQILIAEVRDATLRRMELIIGGKLKSATAQMLHQQITEGCSPELAQRIATEAIDAALFRLLNLLDENAAFSLRC
ncbi:hypothetical protein [Chitinilyticum piscinae]|uniref:Uncharacterized protein n=1 Tax=Chitinilyticum piscinae TaxID=2866724 RepID=A0A8J7K8R7_9NEIS|nr:hypothetical protein [Chitinilyticum piscinae]MBE9610003.1 hypothetical protein [Chitinilyticum piscinae]